MSLPKPYYQDDWATIYHGDALDVLPMLCGIGAVVTDPPYSSGGAYRGDRVRKTSEKYVQSGTAAYRPEFSGDNRDQRSFLAWCVLWMSAAYHASNDQAYLVSFIDWRQLPTLSDAIQAAGWVWQGVAPWVKPASRPRPDGFCASAEFLLWSTRGPMGERDGKSARYAPGYTIAQPEAERQHIAQKPVAVLSWALSILPPGALVVDPFMGSGTTLVAAKERGLCSVGLDTDERYCEIAAKRLAQETIPFVQPPPPPEQLTL